MKNILYQAEHSLIAIAVSFLDIPFDGQKIAIFVGIVCFFVSREIAQAEYKYIHLFCGGKRAGMAPFAWVSPVAWDSHSFWGNMTAPIAISAAMLFSGLLP